MSPSLTSRTQAASVIFHDKILLMGGKQVGKRVKTIEEYDRDDD